MLLTAYARWGAGCLERLNGMFAFAIHDRETGTLFCARDRLGVKPFVYAHRDRAFAFASEHKALVAGGVVSGEMDPDAVYEYLARGYLPPDRSFFAGITPLLPGHALEVDDGGALRVWEWWQPEIAPDPDRSRAEWVERIGELVTDAVRLRLRSDVPVGCHLSGGLDSSAIVAAAARHGLAVDTFTGAFPADPGSDERRYARGRGDVRPPTPRAGDRDRRARLDVDAPALASGRADRRPRLVPTAPRE